VASKYDSSAGAHLGHRLPVAVLKRIRGRVDAFECEFTSAERRRTISDAELRTLAIGAAGQLQTMPGDTKLRNRIRSIVNYRERNS
jgi:hypothetical protein